MIAGIPTAHAYTNLKSCAKLITPEVKQQLIEEHIRYGLPSEDNLEVTQSYITAYDSVHNVPKWTAWHATKEYLDTPIGIHNKQRVGVWARFRTDPLHPNVKPNDYTGWFKVSDIIKGHLTPYFVSGGDRNDNGKDAEIEGSSKVEDAFDACATFEINSMSNITPQYQHSFNGSGGAWFALESKVRNVLREGRDLNEIAGTIFLKNEPIKYIGNRKRPSSTWDIGIPHGFYKIILDNNTHKAFAFLFGHDLHVPGGCDTRTGSGKKIKRKPSQCMASISQIEKLSGLTFFPKLSAAEKNKLFSSNTAGEWVKYTN